MSDSEPRLVLMVGRARRVGTEPVIGNIFLPTLPREAIPGVMLQDVAERLSDVATIESPPRMEGRSMLMVLGPNVKQ